MLAQDAGDASAAVQTVRVGLILAWVIAGVAVSVRRPHEPLGPLVLAGTVLGGAAAASAAALLNESTAGLEVVRAAAVGLLPALGLYLVLALPTGELARRSHRAVVGTGYVVALVGAVAIWAARPSVPLWILGLEAVAAAFVGGGLSNARYRRSRGQERQRMQWFGWAVTVAGEVALVAIALRLFLGWPRSLNTVVVAATVTIPLSFVLSTSKRLVAQIDSLLAHTVSFTGLTGVVVAVYLVIVLGLGRTPDDDERSILLLSMVAAGIATLLYLPTRERLTLFSNRLGLRRAVRPRRRAAHLREPAFTCDSPR